MKAISFLLLLGSCASYEETDEQRLHARLVHCYEESDSVAKIPPHQGKMKLRLDVSGEGKVKSVTIQESDFRKDRNLEACVSGIMKESEIPPPVRGKDFIYFQPINFIAKKNENF